MDFPDERFKVQTLRYRPIGVGIAGLSDAMFKLGLPYNNKEGKQFAEEVMRTITHGAIRQSIELAKIHGPFYQYDRAKTQAESIVYSWINSEHDKEEVEKTMSMLKEHGIYNCTVTAAAPTGTTAISCDCSYGIEPCFGLVWEKTLSSGDRMKFINPIFEEKYRVESWYTPDLIEKIYLNGGSLKNIRGVPKDVKEVFLVAHDVKAKDKLELQAAIQRRTSQGVSSTVNLPNSATVDDIKELYSYAHELGLKGITVYRDGCKKIQPVSFKKEGVEVISHFKRPTTLDAKKHCIELSEGKLYIDVVKHEGRIVEVWLDYGKSGQELNGLLEALGKSLSTGFQHGVPKEAYIKQFKGIKGEHPIWFRFEDGDKKPHQLQDRKSVV